jgi:hypothetical protein
MVLTVFPAGDLVLCDPAKLGSLTDEATLESEDGPDAAAAATLRPVTDTETEAFDDVGADPASGASGTLVRDVTPSVVLLLLRLNTTECFSGHVVG